MSPEQCRGKAVDLRTDIYSFGVLAYFVLTAQLPFDGDYMDLVLKHLQEPPPRPSSHVALPLHVDEAILAMLRKDPAHRPQTIGAALSLLEAVPFESTTPLPSRPSYPPNPAIAFTQPGASTTRRPRRTSRVVGVGLGLAVAGAAIGVLLANRDGERQKLATPEPTHVVAPPPIEIDAAPVATVDAPVLEPPPPTERTITLAQVPATAKLALDGKPFTGATFVLPLDGKPHTLRITAPNHEPFEHVLDASTPATIEVELRRKKPRTPTPPPPDRGPKPIPL